MKRNRLNHTERFIWDVNRTVLSPWPTRIYRNLLHWNHKSKLSCLLTLHYILTARIDKLLPTSIHEPQEFQLSTEDPQSKSPFSSKIGCRGIVSRFDQSILQITIKFCTSWDDRTYMILKFYTLFLDGPSIPGGSCSLSDQVTPLLYDRFMHPLHLSFDWANGEHRPGRWVSKDNKVSHFHIVEHEGKYNITICYSISEQKKQKSKTSFVSHIENSISSNTGRKKQVQKSIHFQNTGQMITYTEFITVIAGEPRSASRKIIDFKEQWVGGFFIISRLYTHKMKSLQIHMLSLYCKIWILDI